MNNMICSKKLPARDRLPKMTEDQISLLEKKMLFMWKADQADELHFSMKNEFWDGWHCYWGPMLAFEIRKYGTYIEVCIRDGQDFSKNRKFIHACE